METIILKNNENYELRLNSCESRVITLFVAGPANAAIHFVLADNARLRVVFLFAGTGDDRISARLSVCHEGADSVSEVIARGVLYNRSNAVVEGAVSIAPAAQRANARFEGKALIEGAGSADIVPILEILAPDAERVCHAAAVARLSDEERFYLESRGLNPAEAVRVAAQGFLSAPFSCAIEIPKEFEDFIKKLEYAV